MMLATVSVFTKTDDIPHLDDVWYHTDDGEQHDAESAGEGGRDQAFEGIFF